MKKAFVLACLFGFGVASPVLAANANRPYQNCNRKIDNCGPTGNDTTDQLNARQLGGGSGGQGMQDNMNSQSMPMDNMHGQQMPMQGAPMQGTQGMRR